MIVVDNAADKALMALITELFGLIVEAFAAVVADQSAVSAVVILTALVRMAGTFFDYFHTECASLTVNAVILCALLEKRTFVAHFVGVLKTVGAMIVRGFPAVLAEVAFDAEFFILTVIAYLAIYAEIIQHAGLAVVIISEFE
jgi:hypothetical protein